MASSWKKCPYFYTITIIQQTPPYHNWVFSTLEEWGFGGDRTGHIEEQQTQLQTERGAPPFSKYSSVTMTRDCSWLSHPHLVLSPLGGFSQFISLSSPHLAANFKLFAVAAGLLCFVLQTLQPNCATNWQMWCRQAESALEERRPFAFEKNGVFVNRQSLYPLCSRYSLQEKHLLGTKIQKKHLKGLAVITAFPGCLGKGYFPSCLSQRTMSF